MELSPFLDLNGLDQQAAEINKRAGGKLSAQLLPASLVRGDVIVQSPRNLQGFHKLFGRRLNPGERDLIPLDVNESQFRVVGQGRIIEVPQEGKLEKVKRHIVEAALGAHEIFAQGGPTEGDAHLQITANGLSTPRSFGAVGHGKGRTSLLLQLIPDHDLAERLAENPLLAGDVDVSHLRLEAEHLAASRAILPLERAAADGPAPIGPAIRIDTVDNREIHRLPARWARDFLSLKH